MRVCQRQPTSWIGREGGRVAATYRAEHVGSLLRPPELPHLRQDHRAGRIELEQLREAEDRAALANIQLQRETC